jgi:predicted anti-sigma-YlaC factor YlaD
MQCSEVQEALSEYADDLADTRSRRIAEQHVRLCHSCRQQLEAMRVVGQQLERLPLLPVGISDRVPLLRRHLADKLARRHRVSAIARVVVLGIVVIALMVLIVMWAA